MSTIDRRSRASRGVRAEALRRRPSPSRKPQKHASRILLRGLGRRLHDDDDDAGDDAGDRETRIITSHHTYSYGKRLRTASRVALLRQRKADRDRSEDEKRFPSSEVSAEGRFHELVFNILSSIFIWIL